MRGGGRDDVPTAGRRSKVPYGAGAERSPESADGDMNGLKVNDFHTTSPGGGMTVHKSNDLSCGGPGVYNDATAHP